MGRRLAARAKSSLLRSITFTLIATSNALLSYHGTEYSLGKCRLISQISDKSRTRKEMFCYGFLERTCAEHIVWNIYATPSARLSNKTQIVSSGDYKLKTFYSMFTCTRHSLRICELNLPSSSPSITIVSFDEFHLDAWTTLAG